MNMKIKKSLQKKNFNLYIFILAFVFLLTVPLLRSYFNNSIVIGEEAYYHLRIAEQITKEGIPTHDNLSNSDYTFNPLHILLSLFVYFIGEKTTSIFFPFMLGLLSLVIYLKILEKWGFDPIKKLFAFFILILSPIFIYTFSTINSFSLVVFLNLAGFYFFMTSEKRYLFFLKKEKKLNFYLSLLIFAIIPFFGFFNLLITLAILLAYSSFEKSKLNNFYFISFILLIISLIFSNSTIYPFFFSQEFSLTLNVFTKFIFQLGAMPGFRVVTLLLAFIGFFRLWSEEKKRAALFIFLLLFVFSFFVSDIIFYLNFLLVIPATYGFLMLFNMKWKVNLIRKLTLIILIISLLFSSFSAIGKISYSEPGKSTMESLGWLKSNSKENEVVLSYYKNSFWIQKISERPTFLDPTMENNQNYNKLFNITHQIFYGRNLENTASIFKEYNISYIWINKEMKKGKVWKKSDQGLLFLLKNSEIFKKIYDKDNIEIWRFKPDI